MCGNVNFVFLLLRKCCVMGRDSVWLWIDIAIWAGVGIQINPFINVNQLVTNARPGQRRRRIHPLHPGGGLYLIQLAPSSNIRQLSTIYFPIDFPAMTACSVSSCGAFIVTSGNHRYSLFFHGLFDDNGHGDRLGSVHIPLPGLWWFIMHSVLPAPWC